MRWGGASTPRGNPQSNAAPSTRTDTPASDKRWRSAAAKAAAPGVSPSHPVLAEAAARGLAVRSEIDLAYEWEAARPGGVGEQQIKAARIFRRLGQPGWLRRHRQGRILLRRGKHARKP